MRREIDETLAEFEARGELDPALRERLRAALRARLDAPRDHAGRVIGIVATFGALSLAAGLLYLVGYNWDALGKAAKLALVFGTWIAVHAAGFALAERPGGYPRLGQALSLVGMLCFGGAIYLVAQIYHLSAHEPWALLLWWALDLPLAWWLRSRPAQAVVTGLFVMWAFAHANVWYHDRPEAAASWRYEFQCNLLLGAGLAALFAALAALASVLRGGRYTALWRALALPGALFAAYLASFHDFADRRLELAQHLVALRPGLLALAAALLALGVAHARGLRGELRTEAAGVLLLVGTTALVALFATELLPIAGNLLLLAALLGLAWHGTRTRSAAHVNLALGFFALLIVTRYVEYLWDRLQGAYAFLGCGVLLLALGWFLERRRRALMLRVRGGAA